MPLVFRFILLFLTLATLTACNDFGDPYPLVCTKIGCSDGIVLKLGSSLPDTSIIEIITSNGTLKSIQCSQGLCSNNFVLIEGITPTEFTLKISNGESILHQVSYTPTYTLNKPNGPDCPPECKQTELSIAV